MPPPGSTRAKKNKNKTKLSGSDTEPEPTTEDQVDQPTSPQGFKFITNDQLDIILKETKLATEAAIKDAIKCELTSLKNEIVRLQSELETANNSANNATKLAEQLQKDCILLKEANAEPVSYTHLTLPTGS